MLTKEEYIDIIDFLDFFYGDSLIATAELRKEKSKELQKEDVVNFKSKLDTLRQLIEEHFDNPPLKFEELKDEMVVWDDFTKEFIKIEKRHNGMNNVDHPKHYTQGGIECIDEMLMVFGVETVKAFCLCNVWKYRSRAIYKNGEEDLKKANWYMSKYKELMKHEI